MPAELLTIHCWGVICTTRGDRSVPEKQAPPPHPPGEKRLLVVANETVGGSELLEELERRARGRKPDVLVVTPAPNSPLRHWVSDEDAAREAKGPGSFHVNLYDALAALDPATLEGRARVS